MWRRGPEGPLGRRWCGGRRGRCRSSPPRGAFSPSAAKCSIARPRTMTTVSPPWFSSQRPRRRPSAKRCAVAGATLSATAARLSMSSPTRSFRPRRAAQLVRVRRHREPSSRSSFAWASETTSVLEGWMASGVHNVGAAASPSGFKQPQRGGGGAR